MSVFRPSILCLMVQLCAASMADDRPNILFIMSDDHAAHAISAYGSHLAEIAPTPTIDRLAREGALFTNAFCTNSICSPSRACILTGQYAHTNGAFDLAGQVEPGKQMLALQMRAAGYHTAMIGKWHLKSEPADFEYYCVLPGQGSYHDPEFRIRGTRPWGKNLVRFDGSHVTDAVTDISLNWLRGNWDRTRPFFLMHHFKAPHDYFDNAHRYESWLRDTQIPEPATLWERGPQFGSLATRGADDELLPHIGTSIGNRNPRRSYLGDLPEMYPDEFPVGFDPKNYSQEQNKRFAYNAYLRKYLRCIRGIDDNLARLFAWLEQNGQLDRTIIIYTGDQGFMLGEHDYQDKRWMYEESQRMPLLIRYPPAVPAGLRTDAIVENVDFGPTMLDFAAAETPESVQGRSFRAIVSGQGEPADWRQEAYYRYWMHMAHHDNPAHVGIRTKTHKLIYYYGCNYDGGYQTPAGWELYDLVNDPAETINMATSADHQKLLQQLKQRLAAARIRTGDDGHHFPACERILQHFWEDNAETRAEAVQVSHNFLKRRLEELQQNKRNPQTWQGK